MGNIFKWAGPLEDDWLNDQRDLAKEVMRRMRSFGMKTVQPGFAGNIPRPFEELYPNAKITKQQTWSHFQCDLSW